METLLSTIALITPYFVEQLRYGIWTVFIVGRSGDEVALNYA
jgi:hypothetical protein